MEVKDIKQELKQQESLMKSYLLSGNNSYLQQQQESKQKMETLFQSLEKKLITPEGRQYIAETRQQIQGYQGLNEKLAAAKQKGDGSAITTLTAQAETAGAAAEKQTDRFVAFLIERMDLRITQNQTMTRTIEQVVSGIQVAVFLLAAVMAFWLARQLVRPLRQVVRAAQAIADGNLQEQQLSYHSNDEIQDLLTAFHSMRHSLQNLLQEVNEASRQVNHASELLHTNADQSATTCLQIAESITEVAQGADQQLSSVQSVNQAAAQMMQRLQAVTAQAAEVVVQAAQSQQRAVEGERDVQVTVQEMQALGTQSAAVEAAIDKLSVSSQQIGEIAGVIAQIAGQTNLLALNAAIEAARAGEQGRGFAVVADEVRKLAEQTQQAVGKIDDLIRQNQAHIQGVVVTAAESVRSIAQSVELVQQGGSVFTDITDFIRQMSAQIKEMDEAIQTTAKDSQAVSVAVGKVEIISRSAAAQSQTVSAATEEQTASMHEMARASQELAAMASRLQQAVQRFRL